MEGLEIVTVGRVAFGFTATCTVAAGEFRQSEHLVTGFVQYAFTTPAPRTISLFTANTLVEAAAE